MNDFSALLVVRWALAGQRYLPRRRHLFSVRFFHFRPLKKLRRVSASTSNFHPLRVELARRDAVVRSVRRVATGIRFLLGLQVNNFDRVHVAVVFTIAMYVVIRHHLRHQDSARVVRGRAALFVPGRAVRADGDLR